MALDGDLSTDERATLELVTQLVASESLDPLIARLRDGDVGPGGARDALRVIAELDPDLLVQVTLDNLITTHVEDPGLALQPRRTVGGQDRIPD
jgi:hypothetical protein